MYPHLHQLFVRFLGYAARDVLADIAGDAGRPDLTCRAPSGLPGAPPIDWIVVEAKDGKTHLENPDVREALFAEKSKYITPDTAWFVMINPSLFIARPVMSGDHSPVNDIEFSFHAEGEEEFERRFAALHASRAGVPDRLRRFREGDTRLIATDRLIARDGATRREENRALLARRNFYSTLRNTTRALQDATLQTLRSVQDDVQAVAGAVSDFEAEYGPYVFDAHALTIKAHPRREQRRYGADVAKLNRKLRKSGSISRLAIIGWPQFRARISVKDDAKGERQAQEMFATETANLILARILLIRFFEDHGFFGTHKYLCNGGVAAFQELRRVFEQGYTRLLKMAYEKAQALYAAAFDETELDWVFDAHDERLSGAIEWAMYQLSRYDFTTVRGDILTGIYDRFLDRDQRKKFGEYFTPPSIARYIVDRLDLTDGDRFLDPACGSGTFLIERYQQAAGEDADRGVGSFEQSVAALEKIAGNDLNTFSAVLAQIQLLWHILPFRAQLQQADDFPDIAIADKASSVVTSEADEALPGRWAELDQLRYGGVGGNPPYVRPERGGALGAASRHYFEEAREFVGGGKSWPGISPEANLYALFLYRALDHWCRQPNKWGEGAGRVGFIVQLSMCGSNENADIRALFGPEGRWTIKEIVDFEVIWKYVFDVRVLPMIIIAEARPPRLPISTELLKPGAELPTDPVRQLQVRAARLQPFIERRAHIASPATKAAWQIIVERNRARWEPDKVTIRLADKSVVDVQEGSKRHNFRVADAEVSSADYPDIFTPDGRIMTRLTAERREILKKLLANDKLENATRTYWYKRAGKGRGSVQLEEPSRDLELWQPRFMLARGLVWRGKKPRQLTGGGYSVYKGENVILGGLSGEPQNRHVDISPASDLSLFRIPSLPRVMWAIARITVGINAVKFDPKVTAFTDTVSIFAPRPDLEGMPFDLLLTSRIYRYFFVLAARMSYLDMWRSEANPTNLRLLPWNEALSLVAKPLEALRPQFLEACQAAFRTEEKLTAELAALPLRSLRDVVRDNGGTVQWSESFESGVDKIEVGPQPSLVRGDLGWRLQISEYLADWIILSDEDAAKGLHTALRAMAGKPIDRDMLLALPIAPDAATRADYEAMVELYGGTDHMAAVEAVVDKIDALVGPALGLDADDIAEVRRDMLTDPFLKHIVPRWPGTETRIHGYRTGLDSSERYS